MQVHMTFKHMDATDAIKAHANEKTEKLFKFVNGPFQIDWTFAVNANLHVADVRVHGPNIDYFAEARTGDLYLSIDQAVDKVEKQLRKHKEILKDHLHRK